MKITADLCQTILLIDKEAFVAVSKQFVPSAVAAIVKINIMAVNEMHGLTEILFIRFQ